MTTRKNDDAGSHEARGGKRKETGKQVDRLERVFESIDKKPVAKKCEAMEGIIKEAASLLKDTLTEEKAASRD
jgi:ferritin-like metal-binding protein YciE